MPRIVFKNNEHQAVDLTEAVTLGRSASHANVVIKDNRLSRAHCRFEPREDGWSIVDLESQNGTFLNGRRVRESLVKAGDVVTIGACDIEFEETGGPGPSTVMEDVRSSAGDELELSGGNAEDDQASTRTMVAPAALMLVKGTLQDKIHPITTDPFMIGRKHDNQLCLENDGKASGHHAHIRRDGADYVLEDLGSTNGSLVNGQKIEGPVVLKPGMKLLLGQQLFKFQLQGKDSTSSGRTAPRIAAADVQARLSPPGQAGGEEDLSELDEPHNATIAATPAEQAALNEDDEERAVLSQHVAYKGRGGGLFAAVEIVVVIAVAGAILFAAWTMMKDDGRAGGGGAGNYPPKREGGLLTANSSFDDVDEGGYAKGWNYIVNGTDSFNLVEGAHGGQYAMQISRFSPGNQASYLVSQRMDVPGKGVQAGVFALNSEAASGHLGSAQLSIFWYAHKRDSDPMLVSPIAARTGMREWSELKGSAAAPKGARQFAVALGMLGTQGSVAFDDVTVSAADNAESWFTPQSRAVDGGMTWKLDNDGEISLEGPDGVYFKGGRIALYQTSAAGDPLDVMSMLVEKPKFESSNNRLYATCVYFDPIAGADVALKLSFGSHDGAAQLVAGLQPTGSAGLDKASRYVTLHILATSAWVPAEFVRFEKAGDVPVEYANEIAAGGKFRMLLSANTGKGNKVVADEGDEPRVTALSRAGGREMLFTRNLGLDLSFSVGGERDELQKRAAMIAEVQEGEDQVDRVDRAVSIFRDFLYNDDEVAAAADAIDAASKHYLLRRIELQDGINKPQLTRNEQLYRAAMKEAIASSDKLNAASERWEESAEPLLDAVQSDHMLARTKQSAKLARKALDDLVLRAKEFKELADVARKALFTLEIQTEQRDSQPYMVSARDFLDSGQTVQGMVKLRAVVDRYPRCVRGIEAKERMVDVASILLDEMDDLTKQGLKNIAKDRAMQARDLLKLVEGKLLSNILNRQELAWLRDPGFSPEFKTPNWLSRESDLISRITKLRRRLPADLPEEK